MAIAITLDRPVLTATSQVMENIEVGTAVAAGTDIDFRVFVDDLTIPAVTIVDLSVAPITWTLAGTTLTGIAGSFSNVKVGDVITSTSGTDFANTQIVQTVAADGATLTFLPGADGVADSGNGASTLTFTAGSTGDLDASLYHVKLAHSLSGSILTIVPTVSCHDGSLVFEGLTANNSDEAAYADGTVKTLPAITINLDSYLTNARVPRT